MEIQAKAGFDWSRVEWGGPRDFRTDHCSYCGRLFPDDDDATSFFVPLILWTKDGRMAEFCELCQWEFFGLESFDGPENDQETDA